MTAIPLIEKIYKEHPELGVTVYRKGEIEEDYADERHDSSDEKSKEENTVVAKKVRGREKNEKSNRTSNTLC